MLKGLEFDFDHKVLMTRAVSSQPCCEGFAKLLDSPPPPFTHRCEVVGKELLSNFLPGHD